MVKKTKENLQEGAGLWSKFKILKDKIKGIQYQRLPNNNSSSSKNNTKPNQPNSFQNTNIPNNIKPLIQNKRLNQNNKENIKKLIKELNNQDKQQYISKLFHLIQINNLKNNELNQKLFE